MHLRIAMNAAKPFFNNHILAANVRRVALAAEVTIVGARGRFRLLCHAIAEHVRDDGRYRRSLAW